jgi:hypothetical protein
MDGLRQSYAARIAALIKGLKSFIDITSGANVINVNDILFCIKPENDPQLSHSYSVVPGPFTKHLFYPGML